MMAVLTPRQQLAADLSADLQKMGAAVITPLPLSPDARGLKVQIQTADRDRIVTAICEAKWIPSQLHSMPYFFNNRMVDASLWEIPIPHERQPVPAETKIIPRDYAAEREVRKNMEKELELFRKTIRGQ
jgi:hypothetical protein